MESVEQRHLGSWRELTAFSAYRLFLASVLFAVFQLGLPPKFLGAYQPDLYQLVSGLYIAMALILLVLVFRNRGRFYTLALSQLILDIVVMTLLIYASGGISTGLGLLLVVVVVAGGALIPGRLAVFVAAMAAIAILIEVGYEKMAGDSITQYSHAGMLGATFFATALLSHVLTRKMKTTQRIAEQHARDASKMAVLNQHIIDRMQTGILVVDDAGRVTMCNNAARQMLGLAEMQHKYALSYLVPVLATQFKKWQHKTLRDYESVQISPDLPQVMPRFTHLDSGETVIYLDNMVEQARQAQQMKLASLGQLTASIAHEIRNPLGAISHAGELLAEIHEQDAATQKLTGIIQRHTHRVNTIIETVLNMSRRKKTQTRTVIVALWLEQVIQDFCESQHIETQAIRFTIKSALAKVKMDEMQLRQVMLNLLDNAWHYSLPDVSTPRIALTLFTQDEHVMINIEDNGPGISPQMQAHLFEPFQSDRPEGTGLGLYLSRELCQANGAELRYIEQAQGCCFQISFPIEQQETLL